jgi:predicted lipoprotein with Yx(FWY)xxD motif
MAQLPPASFTSSALMATGGLLAVLANTVSHAADVMVMQGMFTGTNGMALCTFDKDEANSDQRRCNMPLRDRRTATP